MGRNMGVLCLTLVLIFCGVSSASAATPPAKIVRGFVSHVVSALIRRLWSLKSPVKTAVPSRSMIKFEDGYVVETVFDGSKHGIEPYSVEVSPTGKLLVLDSESSNVYRISMPLSRHSRPKLLSGSPEGLVGHVDGRPREARMNRPKGLAVDDSGNIYVADSMNMAIRKISDSGVTTIAGGKWGRGGSHVDGPSEDARFSNDFDVVYIGSSCSLLVVDRGNQAIREIQLQADDCSYEYDNSFQLGIVMLLAAAFFGYMLALLQSRLRAIFSSQDNPRTVMSSGIPMASYQMPPRSVRPPLIPTEDEPEKPEEGVLGSIGKLFVNTGSAVAELFGGLFSSSRKKPVHHEMQQEYHQAHKRSNMWPMQESFVIPREDEPPSLESRAPTPQNAYPFMTNNLEATRLHVERGQPYHEGWGSEYQLQQLHHTQQQQYHSKQYSCTPQTYYEQSRETNEIVFGAVQEQDGRRETVVIKAVDYGDPKYSHQSIRSRYNYVGYSQGY